MKGTGAPVYDPANFRPGFSRDQIIEHMDDVLSIMEELAPRTPDDLRASVYVTVQAMCASMQPRQQNGSGGVVPVPAGPLPKLHG